MKTRVLRRNKNVQNVSTDITRDKPGSSEMGQKIDIATYNVWYKRIEKTLKA